MMTTLYLYPSQLPALLKEKLHQLLKWFKENHHTISWINLDHCCCLLIVHATIGKAISE